MLTKGCKIGQLTSLSVRNNKFGELGCKFIQIYAFKDLVSLNLSRNQITDEGVRNLTTASYLRNIVYMYLDDNELTSESGKHIAFSVFLTKLKHLSLGFNVV